jgi:protease-4
MNRPLTAIERAKIQKSVQNTYNTFITHVSKGRGMSKTAVDEVGQGRVWTGYDAKIIGLIDTYGGIEKAINIAAELAKLDEYRIISLPKKKDPFSEIAIKLGSQAKISNMIMEKIGINSALIEPIENIIQDDNIQARIPFFIKLK